MPDSVFVHETITSINGTDVQDSPLLKARMTMGNSLQHKWEFQVSNFNPIQYSCTYINLIRS